MAENFSESFTKQVTLEAEKAKFGGKAYRERQKLPVILIDKDNKEEYINYIECVRKISETFGQEYSIMAATLVKLYGLDVKKATTDLEKIILGFLDITIGALALSLAQSKETTEKINSSTADKIILDGSDYCFIYMLLDRLFYNFGQMLSFMMTKKYFNDEGVQEVQERIIFMMSQEIETLRKAFKVVECNNSLTETQVLH